LSLIVTGIVAPDEAEPPLPLPLLLLLAAEDEAPLPELLELCATGLTAVITPLTVFPAGSWTLTFSPTFASLCLLASRSTVAVSCVEAVCRTAELLLPPPLDDELLEDFEDELPLVFDEPGEEPLLEEAIAAFSAAAAAFSWAASALNSAVSPASAGELIESFGL